MRTILMQKPTPGRREIVAILVSKKKRLPALPRQAPPPATWREEFESEGSEPLLLRGARGERWLLLKLPGKEPLANEVRAAAGRARLQAEALGRPGLTLDLSLVDGGGEAALVAATEGAAMAGYDPAVLKKDRKQPKVRRLAVAGVGVSAAARAALRRGWILAQANLLARELQNLPPNILTPRALAARARRAVRGSRRIRVRVLGRRELERLRCGALLGVASGSANEPQLVHLAYRPPRRPRSRVAVVGKGLCFDSGGISLKPSARMDEMKFDMSGAAAVIGLFHGLAQGAECPHEVHGILGCVENMPGGAAQRPGDIVRAMNGTTIEVLNTDAEGRLVLADALSYAVQKAAPDAIYDLATLTGAAVVALGHNASAILGNNERLLKKVQACGERVDERCWPLPLWEVHRELAKGQYADLKNIYGPNDGAGTIAGAAFLSYFVGDRPWVHLDIAATAWEGPNRPYFSAGGRGVGVRLLLELLRR